MQPSTFVSLSTVRWTASRLTVSARTVRSSLSSVAGRSSRPMWISPFPPLTRPRSALPTCGWSLTTRRGYLTRSCATTSTGSPDSLGNLKTGSTEQSPVAYFLSLRTATLTSAPTAGVCMRALRLRSRGRRWNAKVLVNRVLTSSAHVRDGHPKGFVRWAIPPLASSSLTRLRLCVPSTLPSFEGTRCTESHAPSAALRPTARRLGFRACPAHSDDRPRTQCSTAG